MAASFNNLALLYNDQGLYAEAEPLFERALAIVERVLGSEHPNLADVLDSYAELKHATGHPQDAAIMASRAKVIRSKHLQENPQGS